MTEIQAWIVILELALIACIIFMIGEMLHRRIK